MGPTVRDGGPKQTPFLFLCDRYSCLSIWLLLSRQSKPKSQTFLTLNH
jgi:hypothetical protein